MIKRVLYLLIFLSIQFQVVSQDSTKLHYDSILSSLKLEIISGNNQQQRVNEVIEDSLIVKVVDSLGVSQSNIPVNFYLIKTPSAKKDYVLSNEIVVSDSNGIAKVGFVLGSKTGNYIIGATIADSDEKNVAFNLTAKKSNWWFLMFVGLIGGLAIFLYGMNMMSIGMKQTAGNQMRSILKSLTSNKYIALVTGTFTTVIVQSSSAISVLIVSLVQSKLMTFSRSVAVLLGVGIGTTITAQLIAFKLTDYALLFIAIGFFINISVSKKKHKSFGNIILGFGLLFFGMYIMSESMYPLRTYQPFLDVLTTLENPVAGIIVGFVFTALIQSSSAFIGILVILASQGFLSLEAGIPLLLGSNIGTTVTALLSSIRTTMEAKRVAYLFTFIKVLGVLMVIGWIPWYSELIKQISPDVTGVSSTITYNSIVVPRQIANAHTVFNVLLAIILLPITNLLGKLTVKLFPDKPEKETSEFQTVHLQQKLLSTPALALNLAKMETLRMSEIVKGMLVYIIQPFVNNKEEGLDEILIRENEVDFLKSQITKYVSKINQQDIDEDQVDELFQIMYTINELEEIADIISATLHPKAKEWVETKTDFSEEGKAELVDYHLHTLKQLSRAIDTFESVNLEKAEKIKEKHKKYITMAVELKRNHFIRISEDVSKSISSSKTHMQLIGAFRMITSHSTNIGRVVLVGDEQNNK